MTNINIKITVWYNKDDVFKEYKIDCESENESRWGINNTYKTLEEIANDILLEVEKHRTISPTYSINPDEGSHPKREVSKYPNYEYSAEPEKSDVGRLEYLLKEGIIIDKAVKFKGPAFVRDLSYKLEGERLGIGFLIMEGDNEYAFMLAETRHDDESEIGCKIREILRSVSQERSVYVKGKKVYKSKISTQGLLERKDISLYTGKIVVGHEEKIIYHFCSDGEKPAENLLVKIKKGK